MPLVTAHSGCEDTPENSIESILAGVRAGADTVEIDVRATRDGTPILLHDPTVWHEGKCVAVEHLDLDELGAARGPASDSTGDFPEITTLERAFSVARSHGIMVNVDLKDDACIDGVVRLVRQNNLEDMVVLTGCDAARARVVRATAPELRVLLNADAPRSEAPTAEYMAFVEQTYRSSVALHCCGVNVAFAGCRKELVMYGHRRYLPVSVWTVDADRDLRQMIAMGVYSITTYRPRLLTAMLGREEHISPAI